ncbi:MAG: hypothetical protein DRN96_02780 [Thermoproteota archaeon]|nr:MAG: hypothetical protein DRN96_02780 [Candidatus Korarchaeota archaeon]
MLLVKLNTRPSLLLHGCRLLVPDETLFLLVFALVVLLLITEKYHRSLAALLGLLLTVFFGVRRGIMSGREFIELVDIHVLIFIVSVMVLCEGLSRSRFFHFIGLWVVKATRGELSRLFISFQLLTAILTVFLNEIAVMLIMGSLTLAISERVRINIEKWILFEAVMTDIGGMLLPISSIPNLIVASELNLGFIEFARAMMPIVLLLIAVTLLYLIGTVEVKEGKISLEDIDPWSAVEDRGMLYKSVLIFSAVIVLFFLQEELGVSLEMIALAGATAMLILGGEDPDEIFRDLDWSTVFFLGGFFVIIGGLEKSGALELLGSAATSLLAHSKLIAVVGCMWIVALLSAVMDNIPVTLTMIPLTGVLASNTGAEHDLFAWSIVLGANIGGKMLPFASPSTVVALGLLKREGIIVRTGEYFKKFIPLLTIHLIASSLYLTLLVVLG